MLKKVLLGIALLLVIVCVVISLKPSEFRITRSAVIPASPEKVFAQVNDFHNWQAWSPWAKLDPNAKATFEGPSSGVGATFKWSGNNEVGEGAQTIIDSRANELIVIKLEFDKPFKAVNTTEFVFTPQGGQTLVTWSMSGKNNFVSKAVDLFIDCDKMVGSQFEQGLAQLKTVVEK
jgi:uncharacterized protein YndB with AHSA1/START domain